MLVLLSGIVEGFDTLDCLDTEEVDLLSGEVGRLDILDCLDTEDVVLLPGDAGAWCMVGVRDDDEEDVTLEGFVGVDFFDACSTLSISSICMAASIARRT